MPWDWILYSGISDSLLVISNHTLYGLQILGVAYSSLSVFGISCCLLFILGYEFSAEMAYSTNFGTKHLVEITWSLLNKTDAPVLASSFEQIETFTF